MLEVGKIYKLKKIKDFEKIGGHNVDTEYKILKFDGDTVYCQNQETKELNMFNKQDFIDPEFPEDIYSNLNIVWEKLEAVMKPMSVHFWKTLKEEATFGSLGAAPCPSLGAISGGGISAATVNGLPVPSQSMGIKKKKKRKKKNEEILFVDDVINELLNENFLEDYENITDVIAKQLDRLNFHYANTDDIIYKKEGDLKYLIKFDNELGLLKVKVSKDQEILFEKEYQLETEEDVNNAFVEIEDIYRSNGI